jgi:hypothetical protein
MATLDDFRRTNKGGSNDGIYAEFFVAARQNHAKSKETGRPYYEDKEMVKIIIAGDNKTEVLEEVNDGHRARFARQYEAFKQKTDQISANGTPLSQWPVMTPALVNNFAGVGIYTVEQLSQMTDSSLQAAGMGAREWKKRAEAFLEQAKDGAVVQKLAAENEALRNELAGLRRQNDALAERLEKALEEREEDAPASKRPRRPKSDLSVDQGQAFTAPQMPTVL